MKEIKAYIKQHKLTEVTIGLHSVKNLTGMSVVNVRGFGRSRKQGASEWFSDEVADYVRHVKIEIVCEDEMVDEIVSIIIERAHTGLRGDGRIFISNVESAIRIETGGKENSA